MWRTPQENALMMDGWGMVEPFFYLRLRMAGVDESEIRTPREWFPNQGKHFFGYKQPQGRMLLLPGNRNEAKIYSDGFRLKKWRVKGNGFWKTPGRNNYHVAGSHNFFYASW